MLWVWVWWWFMSKIISFEGWITLDINLIVLPATTLSSATPSISISWQIPTAVEEYPVVAAVRELFLRVGRESILLAVGRREYSSKIHQWHHDKLYYGMSI